MKRLLAMILAAFLTFSLAACGGGDGGQPAEAPSGASDNTETPPASAAEPASTPDPDPVPEPAPEIDPEPTPAKELPASGELGDYAAQVYDFELAQDFSGNPAIVIGYQFVNNSDQNQSGMAALHAIAFQNGIQLDTAIMADSGILNAEDQMKEVQPGASIDLKSAYILTSETAPVEFELSELFSLSDERIGKTFSISDGSETILSTAPAGEVSGNLGDYVVSVVSHDVAKDYQDAPALIITLGFTNNGDTTSNFMTSIDCSAFQNGVELESAIMSGENGGNGESQMRGVKPGAGTQVTAAYLLASETAPVELEISELISFSDDKIETTINLPE